jgi:hypothetical protein
MKKQTAIEFLIEQIDNKDMGEIPIWIYDLCEELKEMEKEQIIDAYLDGANACDLEVKGDRVLLIKPDTNLLGQEYFLENF